MNKRLQAAHRMSIGQTIKQIYEVFEDHLTQDGMECEQCRAELASILLDLKIEHTMIEHMETN